MTRNGRPTVWIAALAAALLPWTALAQGGRPSQTDPPAQPDAPDEAGPEETSPEPVVGDQPAVPGETDASSEDRQLQQRLRAAFAELDALAKVDVAVRAGIVHLKGSVPTPSARDHAQTIAARFEHTLFVNNQLDVSDAAEPTPDAPSPGERTVQDEQIQGRLMAVFEHVDELEKVGVQVTSGVVRLQGTTTSLDARNRAEELARNLEGVLYVDNDVDVPPDVSQRVSPIISKGTEMLWRVAEYLPLLAIGLVILALFGLLARFVGRVEWPFSTISSKPLVQGLVRQTVAVVVFLGGILFVLELFDVTTLVGAVLGTAGVAGLALGFAFRDIAENYLASIILSVQQPFRKNDYIEVDGREGKVIRMTTRDTVLMTLDGNHIRIPNSTVFKHASSNYTRNPLRRFECPVGVGVEEDLMEVQSLGLETLRETTGVTEEPEPFMYVEELGDSNVVVCFYGWVDQNDYDWGRVQSESLRRIKSALDAAGIEMPEPIFRNRVLRVDEQAEKADRAKRKQQGEQGLQEAGPPVEQSPEIDEQIEADREHSEETDLLE